MGEGGMGGGRRRMYYIMREGCIRLRLPSSPSCGWPSPGMRKCRKVQQARGRGAIRAYRVTWSWEISRRGGFSEEDLYITREEDLYIMASRGRRI